VSISSKTPFEIDDFSLGITDDVFEKDPRHSIELDNFNIEPDGSLKSRPGYVIEVADTPQIPSGVKRIGALINYNNGQHLLVQSERNFYFRDPLTYTTILGPTGNPAFSVGTQANNISFSEWGGQVIATNDGFPNPIKIFKSGSNFKVVQAGLPSIAAPTITPAAGPNSYIYAFHYSYTYTVGSQTFEDVGPITEVTVLNADAPNITTIVISAIPVLSNGSNGNFDTSNIKIKIFRTKTTGTVLYYVGEVTNGTTTFNDTFSDTTILANELLYSEDGSVDFEPLPLHKYNHIVNGIGYYGNIKDGSVLKPNVVFQSIPNAPSSTNADFFIELEDEVRGISSVNSIPIVLCKRHIYRLENNFDQFGRGGINYVRISDTAGCISHLSIVSAEGGIYWAGEDGFYASDGYKVQKISDKINSRYMSALAAMSDTQRIYGKFDKENRRVLWALRKVASSLENDSLILLDLRWGIRSHSTFTTWSGESFRPAALEFYKDKLYTADSRGYVYYHDSTIFTDPKVDTTISATNWNKETIIWNYTSVNYNFGSSFFRKKPTRILLTARNIANTSIQIISIDDDGKRERNLKPIRWRRNFVWGDINFIWGSPDCIWRGLGVIEQWRRFPARGLRVSYMQIKITNAYAIVVNSDTLEEATFNGAANTATFTKVWPENSVDYFISTEFDNYALEYKVSARTATQLTLIDSSNTLPTGTFKWVLKGYRKGEPLNLQGYIIHTANEDQNQETFEIGNDGENN
jgi:hypothetical protein